ncbi:heme oxygenase [Murinocardiopsis flavida]|uniref:Heme oxygenase n=1 Tax=Murinocardiopsis flavida TaxID=645275 RepID=A0A2P8D500_9ACTN|nr:biliverdin-producing heme oxygenase [Murinocardiopsis flavida]PSK92281.1 heme oxygenase [Murinocardiopsis flavida]
MSTGTTDAEPALFSERLKAATWGLHEAAENHGFTDSLLAGTLPREDYTALVAQHYFAYAALEDVGRELADDPVAGPFLIPELFRLPALRRDLALLLGPNWHSRIEATRATGEYAARIRATAQWPAGYVAHHYTRYIGDLSGGQFIRKAVRAAYGFGDGDGASFYDFAAIGSLPKFKNRYRALLDSLPVEAAEQERVIAETRAAYRCNIEVFADLGRARSAV